MIKPTHIFFQHKKKTSPFLHPIPVLVADQTQPTSFVERSLANLARHIARSPAGRRSEQRPKQGINMSYLRSVDVFGKK